jgi:hypothetical protein
MRRRSTAFRMLGGALSCPPGMYCMDTSAVLTGILIAVLITAVVVFGLKYMGYIVDKEPAKPTVVVVHPRSAPVSPTITLNSDPRFAPLAPERSYGTPADLRGFPSAPIAAGLGALPVNTPTRDIPAQYQQVGVLTTAGGTSTSGSPTRTILPLFGRTVDSARNRWNYYTRTDGMNPVQVPIQYKRRNCDDDNGCEEVSDGDDVGVPIMGQAFTASMYKYSTPRYLPVV